MNKIRILTLIRLLSEEIVKGNKLESLHYLTRLSEEIFTEDEKQAKKE